MLCHAVLMLTSAQLPHGMLTQHSLFYQLIQSTEYVAGKYSVQHTLLRASCKCWDHQPAVTGR